MSNLKFVNGDMLERAVKNIGQATDARFLKLADAYTAAEIDAKLSSVYKVKGSLASEGLLASLLVAANEGNVYNITDAFTTTADFVEGADKPHTAGSNVVIVEATAAGFKATEDTTAQSGKTYYADAEGTELDSQPAADADISSEGYFEAVEASYKFDVLPGVVDLATVTASEVDAITDAMFE
ncbi:MAG: hypothetical protein IJ520_10825 [Synergistaceae bacterium]|nr:hypothetical protein [Synergistaceae bacterium]